MATQPPITGIFEDSRDGQVYKTVKLKDGNIWMAQNFNFDVGQGCCFYNNDAEKGAIYGRLYTWDAAVRACPEGWRLPSENEAKGLIDLYGGFVSSYNALIKGGTGGFDGLLGGGQRGNGYFFDLDKTGYYNMGTGKDWYYYFDGIGKVIGVMGNRDINTKVISSRYIKG